MLTTVIKHFYICYFSVIISQKSIKTYDFSSTFVFSLSLILSLLSTVINGKSNFLSYAISILILWVILSIKSLNPQASFVNIIISFTISFCTHAIISLLLIANIPFFRESDNYILLSLITGSIQYLFIMWFFSLKRFKNGIPIFSHSLFINSATFLCLILIGFILYSTLNYRHLKLLIFLFICFLFTLAFLIYWWQAQITKSYRRSLEKRELESLRAEGLEKDALIEKLLQDNDRLATITHRDNTLISTLKNSTVTYLRTNFDTEQERIEAGERLVSNIESLSEGRASLQPKSTGKASRTFDTGIPLLDELLHYMDEEAIKDNIIFPVHIGVELKDFVPKDISENDLVHVIDDLLKNAFKATRNSERRMVQLQFYKLGKHFVVEVADNGIPFEIGSLVNMGIEKITTYEDGSGIGLVDIWNTKEMCRATYHLEEYATPSPFTKKISLTFDKKNRYSIRSYRKEEIQKNSKRIDLQIY